MPSGAVLRCQRGASLLGMTKPRALRTRPASDKRLPKVTLLEQAKVPDSTELLTERVHLTEGIVSSMDKALASTQERLTKIEGTADYWHALDTRVSELAEQPSQVSDSAGEFAWRQFVGWLIVHDALLAGCYAYWRAFGFHLPQL